MVEKTQKIPIKNSPNKSSNGYRIHRKSFRKIRNFSRGDRFIELRSRF